MRALVFALVFALPFGLAVVDALRRGMTGADMLGLAVVAWLLANLASVAAGPRERPPD